MYLGGACKLCALLPFWVWVGHLMYICMLHFLSCIISCLHLCIIDSFVSYVIEMCFSHMLWSPWYAKYEFMTLLVMLMRCIAMLLVALGYICLWMAFFLYKMLYDPLLWVECLSCSNWVLMAISCLICAWNHVLFIWDQRSICHHGCLAYMLPKPKLLFAAKALHVPCLTCKS
jgi:hypothetical protein